MYCIDFLFSYLNVIEAFYWSYIGFTIVTLVGVYFTIRSNFYQLKVLSHPIRTIKAVQKSAKGGDGINPFLVYFASVGGMVGLGNIVAIVTAITWGGPGALFWLWIAAFLGTLIKYAEIYLGIKFRVNDERKGHIGGPMIYLQKAFKNKFFSRVVPVFYCACLAIYGVEIAQFTIVTDVLTDLVPVHRFVILGGMLAVTLYGGFGGIRRLANISTALMPPFIIGYISLCLYVIGLHIAVLPDVLIQVFVSAFTGHAAVGGFAGSSMIIALQLGTARAVYSGDLGIGYDSIIQSRSKAKDPTAQACLSIFGVATDAFICTLSALVILVTGVWKLPKIEACHAVAHAFSEFFPHVHIFMGVLIFIAGYSTVIAYLAVGEKAANWLFPKWGRSLYFLFAVSLFLAFSFLDQSQAMTIMGIAGGLLVLTNLSGIWLLRKHIVFK
jgi:AGCS family alanine or glycine:cation symporter